eukprot:5055152-Amphidinium_carterae.1
MQKHHHIVVSTASRVTCVACHASGPIKFTAVWVQKSCDRSVSFFVSIPIPRILNFVLVIWPCLQEKSHDSLGCVLIGFCSHCSPLLASPCGWHCTVAHCTSSWHYTVLSLSCSLSLVLVYGLQEVSHIWQSHWGSIVHNAGWCRGVANPACMVQQEEDAYGVVHGDDFLVLGDQLSRFSRLGALLEQQYEVKMTGCISLVGDASPSALPDAHPSAPQEMQYLHRVIRAVLLSPWRSIDCDQRHIAMIWKELELETGAEGKDLPSVKLSAVELGQIAATAAMTPERVRKYRSLVMRIAYLSLARVDLLECVRHMASRMKDPREGRLLNGLHLMSYKLRSRK